MGSIKCVLLDNKITYKYYTHVANIYNTTAKFSKVKTRKRITR